MCGSNPIKQVQNAASSAVNSVKKGVNQTVGGVQKVTSGDLTGLRDIGAGPLNMTSSLYGTANGLIRDGVAGAFDPLKQISPELYGLTAGNINGALGSTEGILRGNVAGAQALPQDIGAGAQQVLDQAGNIVGDALGALSGGMGGGGSGGYAPESLKRLADVSANYAMNTPEEYQKYTDPRFADPSQMTLKAETALGSQTGSNVQGAYDLANDLANRAQNSQFNVSLSGPGVQTAQGLQTNQGYTNAVNANYRNYSGADVSAGPTMGAQTFSGSSYGSAGPMITPDRYTGQTFDAQNYGAANIQANNAANLANNSMTFQGRDYGNAVDAQGQNYGSGLTFQQDMAQYQNPYNEQVLNRGMEDLNRARQLADQQTSAQAHSAGAFGGSRQALLEAENYRNYLQQAGDMSNQIRSQGFDRAANLASQDRSQRLGLTAQSANQAQQLGAQGALQGQSLTAGDSQSARDATLRSQLQAQQLGSQGDLQTQELMARAAMQGQSLSAQSANQAQQLMAQTGMQAQQLTAGAREQANQLGLQAAMQGQNLTAQSANQAQQLGAQSFNQAADRNLQAALQAQQLGMQSANQAQQLGAQSYNQAQQLNAQGAQQAQQLGAQNLQTVLNNNLQSQLQAQRINADNMNANQNRLLEAAKTEETLRQGAMSQALQGAMNTGYLGNQLDQTQRQQLLDQLQMGQARDARAQQQLDFNYQQFQDAAAYPMQRLQMLSEGARPGSYLVQQGSAGGGGSNPLAGIISGGLQGALATGGNPYGALAGAGMGLLGVNNDKSYEGLGPLFK